MIGTFRQVIATEGAGALLTGLGATASGYFVQGWFKFGGVEFFKINIAGAVGEQVRRRLQIPCALGCAFDLPR